MLRMTAALLLLCFVAESRAQDKARIATGEHSLIATFDEKDSRRNFFHDVNVRSKSERLTLVVLDDLAEKQDEAEEADEAVSKQAKGGLGDPSEDGTAKWPARPLGQEPWLSPKRKVHGTVDAEGVIRFGVTTTRDGKLVSLHFVGRSSFAGASGKVFQLSSEEPVLEGTWKLNNPFTDGGLVPGFNGASPFGR
jgi:hypothetical protein